MFTLAPYSGSVRQAKITSILKNESDFINILLLDGNSIFIADSQISYLNIVIRNKINALINVTRLIPYINMS